MGMKWQVLLDEDFAKWLSEQETNVRIAIASHYNVLSVYGAMLGRPQVDTVKGSKFTNMKELRIQCKGEPWRVLFAFDPKRRSILLVGGNKQSDKRWYDKNIPIADARFAKHLKNMEN